MAKLDFPNSNHFEIRMCAKSTDVSFCLFQYIFNICNIFYAFNECTLLNADKKADIFLLLAAITTLKARR